MRPGNLKTNKPVFVIDSPRRLAAGSLAAVMLDQVVFEYGHRRPGPHGVGKAEVMIDGRLAIWLTENSEAGRTAKAFLADDMIDVVVEGEPPVIWLRA